MWWGGSNAWRKQCLKPNTAQRHGDLCKEASQEPKKSLRCRNLISRFNRFQRGGASEMHR